MAVAVVAIVAIAAVGVYMFAGGNNGGSDEDSNRTVAAIARVNTDGSGIYLKAGYNVDEFYSTDASGKITLNKEAWGGKVFGTPGTSTIQHVQLKGLVEGMGLKWTKYMGGEKATDTVYFLDSIINADAAINKNAEILDGGILWEPQYTKIASNSQYQHFLLTNDLFPGHTCCVIAGLDSFMEKNSDATVAFLAAYQKAVVFINEALSDVSSEKYNTLVKICRDYTPSATEDEIKDALGNIIYKFSDDNKSGSLSDLVSDIASLETDLYNGGSIKVDIKDLGFNSSEEFAKALVDDSYLKKAVNGEAKKVDNVKINVAAIDGDIHQIGIRVATDLGYFEEYGIEVNVKPLGNGGLVAQDILAGYSDFAFLGAPPLTSNVVNGEEIKA